MIEHNSPAIYYEETPERHRAGTELGPETVLDFHKSDLPSAEKIRVASASRMAGAAFNGLEPAPIKVERQPQSPEVAQIGSASLWLVAYRRDGYVNPQLLANKKHKGNQRDYAQAA